MVGTTAHVMFGSPNLHDAITAGHAAVLGQVKEAFRTLESTFEQHWCAKAGPLLPEAMEEFPELRRCPILEL